MGAHLDEAEIEEIPDTAVVARLVDFSRMYDDLQGVILGNSFFSSRTIKIQNCIE